MRTISGAVKSTPLQWLPVLVNIKPPDIQRKEAFVKTVEKSKNLKRSFLYQMILQIPEQRLQSRSPPVETARKLISSKYNSTEDWRKEWANFSAPNQKLVLDPNEGVLGMNLPRSTWSTLNRLRTGHGRCGALLHKWGFQDNPVCDCGNGDQTINHIVNECQRRKFNQGFEGIHVITPETIGFQISI